MTPRKRQALNTAILLFALLLIGPQSLDAKAGQALRSTLMLAPDTAGFEEIADSNAWIGEDFDGNTIKVGISAADNFVIQASFLKSPEPILATRLQVTIADTLEGDVNLSFTDYFDEALFAFRFEVPMGLLRTSSYNEYTSFEIEFLLLGSKGEELYRSPPISYPKREWTVPE